MPVDYAFKQGLDLPSWHWLSPFPQGASYHGTSCAYDGNRYIYWVVQYGSSSAVASTTQLWRYDTWNNGWQYLATCTSGGYGIDVEYDPVRNVVILISGAVLTSWQLFNLNLTSVTYCGVVCAAWALTTLTPVLPATASYGSSLTLVTDLEVPTPIDTGIADVGGTTGTVIATDATGTFGQGMVGLQVTVLTGAQAGQKRTISGVTNKNTLTVTPALPGALAAGDTFQVELVSDVATAGTTTTLTDTTANWTINQYANFDVVITGGTGVGQRRRLASNTATVLTLSAAVTGNPRTGPFTTAPDATSTYQIVPSSDFIYYQPGATSQVLYKIDAVASPAAAWVTLASTPGTINSGANTFFPGAYAPGYLITARGNGTATFYQYNIGTNAWTTLTVFAGQEVFTTGASVAMLHGHRKLFIQKDASQRCYCLDLLTGILEPAGFMPYAAPGGYDGKRAKFVAANAGINWLYIMRAGGQEFYRIPLEWIA